MRTGDYASQARYLSLALKARRVLDLLLDAREGRRSLEAIGNDLQTALLAIHIQPSSGSVLQRLLGSTYEEISTLEDWAPAEQRTAFAHRLQALLNHDPSVDETSVLAEAVGEFTSLENCALARYEQELKAPALASHGA